MALSYRSPSPVPGLHYPQSPGPSFPVDSDKAGPPGARKTYTPSPVPARGSVPSTGLTRSTTSLCRSRAFCFPLGVSEALDGARSCSSRSSRRPRSRCGEAVAGPWRRMARGGPGTRRAGEEEEEATTREPGRDHSPAPPRSEATAGCINAPFSRMLPSRPSPSRPPDTGVSLPS